MNSENVNNTVPYHFCRIYNTKVVLDFQHPDVNTSSCHQLERHLNMALSEAALTGMISEIHLLFTLDAHRLNVPPKNRCYFKNIKKFQKVTVIVQICQQLIFKQKL